MGRVEPCGRPMADKNFDQASEFAACDALSYPTTVSLAANEWWTLQRLQATSIRSL
jgi:hypothetical protein